MIDPLETSLQISGAGLQAQSTRLRIVAENIANAQTTGTTPGANPYARKTIAFESEMDQAAGVNLVQVKQIGVDKSAFKAEYDPGNPGADSNGYVKLSNVNMLMEMADMREANRSYEANLQMVKQTRDLFSMTVDLLKG